MNKNAKKWVKALRSGKYKQTTGALHLIDFSTQKDSFCCLGVACDLFNQSNKNQMQIRSEMIDDELHVLYDGKVGLLPMEVRDWLGLRTCDGQFTNSRNMSDSLTDRNDNGSAFSSIARTIESEPEGLFE